MTSDPDVTMTLTMPRSEWVRFLNPDKEGQVTYGTLLQRMRGEVRLQLPKEYVKVEPGDLVRRKSDGKECYVFKSVLRDAIALTDSNAYTVMTRVPDTGLDSEQWELVRKARS